MSYATNKIFKYLSYNQLSGAPEDWRLHRNKNGQNCMDIWLQRCPSITAMPTILRTTLTLLSPRFDPKMCAVSCFYCNNINTDAADYQYKEPKISLASTNMNPLYKMHFMDPTKR